MSKGVRRLYRGGATFAALTLVTAFTACSSSGGGGGGGKSSYRVAEIADLTGSLAASNIPLDAGLKAYFKKINDAGGVNGKQIDMSVSDSQTSPDAAVAALQKAAANPPVAIVQGGGSAGFAALLPILRQQTSIPFLTDTAPDSALYPSPVAGVYMVQASAKQQATAIVAQLKRELGGSLSGKKVAFLGLTSPYIDAVRSTIDDGLKAEGSSLVTSQRFPFTVTSFSSQASSIAGTKPDAVVLTGTSALTVGPLKALGVAGVTVPVVGYTAGASSLVLKQANLANYVALRVAADPTEAGSAIGSEAKTLGYEKEATDNYFSVGWSMAVTVVEGLKKCGADCDSKKLITAINGLGTFTVPSDALFGSVAVSATKHAVYTTGQFYKYDSATSAVVKAGDPVDLGD